MIKLTILPICGILKHCIGASDMERQREGRSIQLDVTNKSSQDFADDTGGSVDNTSKTAAAASDLAEDRDDDDEEDLSYDEQDSVGKRSSIFARSCGSTIVNDRCCRVK